MTDKIQISITSDEKHVQAIKRGLAQMLERMLNELKLEGEYRHMTTAIAVTAFVWECGQLDDNIPPVIIQTLLNMAVDAGLGERIGMKPMGPSTETMQ